MDTGTDSARLALLATLLADEREAGLRSLEHYLGLFPADAEMVAQLYGARLQPGQSASLTTPQLRPRTLGGYTLLRELGRGGQAVVWLAEDQGLGRRVALKVLHEPPPTGELPPRFEREARATARLEHPAFCPIYEVGCDANAAWIAMRYVEGTNLSSWVEAHREAEDFQPRLLRLIERAARALQHAHEQGIVHRDIKPTNLLVTPDEDLAVLDLGVARTEDDDAPITRSGETFGTPSYMAPEQLRGEAVGPQADVWSLGVTLHEAIAGERPFQGPTRTRLTEAILRQDAPDLARLGASRDLAVLVRAALAQEQERRYSSAQDLAEEIARLQRGEPLQARPLSALGRLRRWARREPALAGALASAVLGMALAITVTLLLLSETRDSLEKQTRLLAEVEQAADHVLAGDLVASESELWPATPDRVSDLREWQAAARGLFDREASHRSLYKSLSERVLAGSHADPASADRDRWLLRQIEELLADLERLRLPAKRIDKRLTFAETLEEHTVDAQQTAWQDAARRVAADSRFDGLILKAQVGLLPLGPDPVSGLEEFAHLASGPPMMRDAESGELVRSMRAGLVMVLIPGGRAIFGAERPGEGSGPRLDPWLAEYEAGLLERELQPFLLSKYEMSQAQWERHTGERPAKYRFDHEFVPAKPVEQISWMAAAQVTRQLDLQLPSEDQWEHAARAGTDSIWYTGSAPETLVGYENLADLTPLRLARAKGNDQEAFYEDWIDDGVIATAPQGIYKANAFGVHDVLGNVAEWTSTGFLWEGDLMGRREPGDALGEPRMYVARGGCYSDLARGLRVARRTGHTPRTESAKVGVRPARSLRE